MTKLNLIGAVAGGVLAIATFATVSPAAADARFGVYVGPTYSAPVHRPSCWHWSYRIGEWVNYCRSYSYYRPAPVYRAYPYRAYPDYGPYAYNYGPSFGFSFDLGGRHHRHY